MQMWTEYTCGSIRLPSELSGYVNNTALNGKTVYICVCVEYLRGGVKNVSCAIMPAMAICFLYHNKILTAIHSKQSSLACAINMHSVYTNMSCES